MKLRFKKHIKTVLNIASLVFFFPLIILISLFKKSNPSKVFIVFFIGCIWAFLIWAIGNNFARVIVLIILCVIWFHLDDNNSGQHEEDDKDEEDEETLMVASDIDSHIKEDEIHNEDK